MPNSEVVRVRLGVWVATMLSILGINSSLRKSGTLSFVTMVNTPNTFAQSLKQARTCHD